MDNVVTLPELQSALDDLLTEAFGVPLEDSDLTIVRVQKLKGCTWDTAKKRLEEMQEAGKIEYLGKRRAESGKMLDAWRIRKEGE